MENRYQKYKETYKKYREENKEKIKEINKNWYNKSKEKIKQYKIKNKEKIKKNQKEWIFNKHFGGLGNEVFLRDNFRCVECGITQEEHIKKYGRKLNIHHKDGNGRNVKNPNNNINNLITLCLRCHQKKHGKNNYNKKCLYCNNQCNGRFCSSNCRSRFKSNIKRCSLE